MLKVLGKGIVFGFLLVIFTTVMLPFVFSRLDLRENAKASGEVEVGFEDLIKQNPGEEVEEEQVNEFKLVIPKIDASSGVVVNVDSSNKVEYLEALKQGVAHVKGTYFPGMGGGVTMFAHSTDDGPTATQYNAVFYRLDELKAGDEITIMYLGKEWKYKVYRSWVTYADDVGVFKRIKNGERLFLVTCTPRGTTEKRLIVEAKLLT